MESAIDLLAAVFLCLSVFAAIKWYSHDAAAFLQFLFTSRRLVIVASCTVFVGLAYGAIHLYRTHGRIHETHTVDEYRFRITSERDPDFADAGEVGEDVHVSVSYRGTRVVDSLYIGGLCDEAIPPTFSVRSLPKESLLIVTRNDRVAHIVFAFDTASGEHWPPPKDSTYEEYRERARLWEIRIRVALADERYKMEGFYGY
jgi:hypothetical protein